MTMTTDTDKIIQILEGEVSYLKGECERWHTLYVEEAEARKNLLLEMRKTCEDDLK